MRYQPAINHVAGQQHQLRVSIVGTENAAHCTAMHDRNIRRSAFIDFERAIYFFK